MSLMITTGRNDVREILRLEVLRVHLDHPARLHEVRLDSHLLGNDQGVHRGNHRRNIHHATKDHRSDMVVEQERWAGMDRDKGKDTVGVTDNKGKDNPQIAGMKLNQGRMPCNKPPMTGLMISAYATVVSDDTAD
jgi:hypothetical protein